MNSKIGLRTGVLCSLAVVPLSITLGATKKTLTAEAYERWNHINHPALTDDGRWAVYTVSSGSGAQELIVRATVGQTEFRVPRGAVPKPWSSDDATQDSRYYDGLPQVRITADSRYALFTIESDKASTPVQEPAAIPRKSPSLGILSLLDGKVTRIENVSSFILPEERGRHVAYRPGEPTTKRASTGHVTDTTSDRKLVLRDLLSATEVQIADVGEFVFDNQGRYLAYTVSSASSERNGVYVRRLVDGQTTALLSGVGRYRGVVFDAAGDHLAFLSDRGSPETAPPRYSIYYAASPSTPAIPAVTATSVDTGLEISAHKGVAFTRVSNALIFRLTPVVPDRPAENRPAHERARFKLRSWQKPWRLQDYDPRLAHSAGDDEKTRPEYLAVYHIAERRWVQLGSDLNPKVLLTDDARYAIGIARASHPRGAVAFWTADISLIDVYSGQAQRLLNSVEAAQQFSLTRRPCPTTGGLECNHLSLSPNGQYLLYFDKRRWWSVDLEKGAQRDLTGSLLPQIPFGFTGPDGPSSQQRVPHVPAIAGWTRDGRRVLLYDAYDIWEFDLAARNTPRNLTAGEGRRQRVMFRLLEDAGQALKYTNHRSSWASSQQIFDTARPLLLFGLNQDTMGSGIWRTRPGEGRAPEPLLMVDKRLEPVGQARHAEQYLVTMETFAESADLWTGPRFDRLRKISDVNPQQSEYAWGTSELIEFTSDFGVPLKGILYKPEDFDASRKYPMIVGIYHVASTLLHKYRAPEPLAASPSGNRPWSEAVSRGYIVFVPDVLSATPYPGQSALAAVIPAVRSILDRGFVDPARVALTGHSFGAYEAGYILTQTSLFRCAVIDAGAYNTISHQGTDMFGTGYTELGQLRHGGSLWERPFVYIANSTVFYADQVQAPVLMMSNEKDGAPHISQGLEFFSALRRNGKEVYLLQYDGEAHGLFGLANRLDWDRRVNAFLDHFLKDAPRASWMSSADLDHTLKQ